MKQTVKATPTPTFVHVVFGNGMHTRNQWLPGLGPEAVRQMTKRLGDDRKLRMASDAVLQYLHRFDIAAN